MKKSSIIFLFSTIISIVAISIYIYVGMRQAIPTWLIISVVVLYTPLCFVQLGIFLKSIESKEEKKIIVKEIMLETKKKKDSIPDSVESSVSFLKFVL